MESLQARIDSFLKSKRLKKNPSKSNSTTTTVKWPHPASFNANPNTLAEAGFYWVPSWDERDSVACFMCFKELSQWDEEDDPFQIHWEKCGHSCPWAMLRCGLSGDIAEDGSFSFLNKCRLPTSKTMEVARLRTFGENLWPHGTDDDNGASSDKMAHAGFVFTPQTKGDDTVTCLYCNVSLSGWDKDDDPIQEHRKRGTKPGSPCAFFSASSSKVTQSKKFLSPVTDAPAPPKAQPRTTRTVSRTRSKKKDVTPDCDSGDEVAKAEDVKEVEGPKTRGKGRVASTSKAVSKGAMTGKKVKKGTKSGQATLSKSTRAGSCKSAQTNASEAEVVVSEAEVVVSEAEVVVSEAETGNRTPSGVDYRGQEGSDVDLDKNAADATPRAETSDGHDLPMVVDEPTTTHVPAGCSPLHVDGGPTVAAKEEEMAVLAAVDGDMLSSEERSLTVEQWIRREIEISYEQLMVEGKKQISLFAGRGREVRQIIEAL